MSNTLFFGFATQWYLISAWHDWAQGDAFGGRMFIVCLPIFVIGIAHFFQIFQHRPRWLLGFVGLLLFLNLLLFVEYRFGLVMSKTPPTWHDLTLGRFTFLIDKLFH